MNIFDYEKFPVVSTFKRLKKGDQVCSKKFGIGTVISFHNKEVIVGFGTHQHRFAEDEKELREFPEVNFKRKNTKVKIEVNGQKMTIREIKRKRKIEEQLAKLIR